MLTPLPLPSPWPRAARPIVVPRGVAPLVVPQAEVSWAPLERALSLYFGERAMTARQGFERLAVIAIRGGDRLVLYKHLRTGRYVFLDELARAYEFVTTRASFARVSASDIFAVTAGEDLAQAHRCAS